MRRAILLVLVLVGCRQQATPLANPFLAPDRVQPPATRTPPPGAAVPYYGGESAPPPVIMHGSAAAWGASGQQLGYIENSIAPVDADALDDGLQTPPNINVREASGLAADSAEPHVVIPTDDHRERFAQLASHEEAAPVARPKQARPRPPYPEIAELPLAAAKQSDAARPSRDRPPSGSGPSGDAFRPRGGTTTPSKDRLQTAALEAPAPFRPPATTPRRIQPAQSVRQSPSRYGHAADYTWLQGKLEHSRTTRQWKLRYIPIDGTTDQYGGSVVLENPDELGDLAAGDFVRIRGHLLGREKDALTFAPLFRIAHVQPLAD